VLVKKLLVVVLLLMLVMASTAVASGLTPEQKAIRKVSFGVTVFQFADYRGAYQNSDRRPWSNLDWSTNGCNDRSEGKRLETFFIVCVQHDFCTRNLSAIVRRKDRIAELCDGKWKKEANRICRRYSETPAECSEAAERIYVRLRAGEIPDF
jgi:Prokaryotic phospholipase A2